MGGHYMFKTIQKERDFQISLFPALYSQSLVLYLPFRGFVITTI